MAIGSTYLLIFWALAGQTPGMSFVGIRLTEKRLSLRRGLKRLLGLYLSVVTLGLGFLGVIFRENRRGWEDRFSGTEVIYDERRPEPAPWSQPAPASVVGAAAGEPALHPEGGAASEDQQGYVDGEHDERAESFVGTGGADRDA